MRKRWVFRPPPRIYPRRRAPDGLISTIATTVVAVLKTFVGVRGTKYKIQMRQTEGTAGLTTVRSRSVLSVAHHRRTILLESNTLIQNRETGGVGYDAYIDGQASSGPRVFDHLRSRESGSSGNFNNHICLEYDVSALEGLVYESVKLRLTNEEDNDFHNSIFRLVRIVRPWALSIGEVSYDQYDRTLDSPAGDWQLDGGRGTEDRGSVSISWLPEFPKPVATDTVTESPDITLIVEEAIREAGGILKLMVQKVNNSSQASRINDYYSSRALGIADTQKPHLFFKAF